MGKTVLVVDADPAAVRAVLTRSGFAVREVADGPASVGDHETVVAVTTSPTIALAPGARVTAGLSAAAILARAGLSGDGRPSYPPRSLPTGW